MTVAANPGTETVEAVIISGPRKGEFISIDPEASDMLEMTPEVEALLDEMVAGAQRMAENARAAATEMKALLQDLHQIREQLS
ncbi:MAG: hypothetical protein JO250_07795 [Armatimonadetes bacterium]|nr:hypothetical protein [Armatimonadota bacterium]